MGRSIYIAPLMGIFPELRRMGVVYVRLRVGWLVLHLDGWGMDEIVVMRVGGRLESGFGFVWVTSNKVVCVGQAFKT